ncbi:MAG: hypothetical protein ACOYZ8_13805 [Chloroflexota bacterium]
MTTTSVPFIRPLSLAELLDQSISLYRRNFVVFIGIIALTYIPLGILQAGLSFLTTASSISFLEGNTPTGLPDARYFLGVLGSIVITILQLILVYGVATAALTRAVADNYTGQKIGVLSAYRNLGSSWSRLLGAILLVALIVIGFFIWTIIPCVGWFTGPGMLFFIALVVSPFVAPVVVLEKQRGFGAFRRAWDLGRGRFWWLIGFALVLWLFEQLLIAVPNWLLIFGAEFIFRDVTDLQQQMILNNVITTVVALLTNLLFLPLNLVARTVVYFDLRVRSEGLDLALQAAAETDPEVNIVSLAETSPAPQGSFINGTDVGYFVLLTLGGGALYVLVVSLLGGIGMLLMSGL